MTADSHLASASGSDSVCVLLVLLELLEEGACQEVSDQSASSWAWFALIHCWYCQSSSVMLVCLVLPWCALGGLQDGAALPGLRCLGIHGVPQ